MPCHEYWITKFAQGASLLCLESPPERFGFNVFTLDAQNGSHVVRVQITPDKLVVLGEVAKKCTYRSWRISSSFSSTINSVGLYTKITGAQRIDMFGAERADLPSIWKELVDAGFESGHAYGMSVYHGVRQSCSHMAPEGKALRTVKSCVGSSWCRYGIGDSVGREYNLIDDTRLGIHRYTSSRYPT